MTVLTHVRPPRTDPNPLHLTLPVPIPPTPTLAGKKIPANRSLPENFDEVLAAFEEDLHARGRSEATVASYATSLRGFVAFYRERLRKPGPFVTRLQETDLHGYIDYLRRDELRALPTVNRAVAALRALAQFLLARGWHRRDIAQELRTFRVAPPKDPPRLSRGELRRLLSAVELDRRNGARDLAILQILLQCGLRVGEVARLVRDDVRLHRTQGSLRVRDEKTRSERTVPLNAAVRRALAGYLQTRGPVAGSDPLFLSERRRSISVKTVQHLVKKYLCASGRGELSAHDLRHHFAASLYRHAGSLTAVQQVLGHSSIVTTARYARSTEEEIREAVESLPDVSGASR